MQKNRSLQELLVSEQITGLVISPTYIYCKSVSASRNKNMTNFLGPASLRLDPKAMVICWILPSLLTWTRLEPQYIPWDCGLSRVGCQSEWLREAQRPGPENIRTSGNRSPSTLSLLVQNHRTCTAWLTLICIGCSWRSTYFQNRG